MKNKSNLKKLSSLLLVTASYFYGINGVFATIMHSVNNDIDVYRNCFKNIMLLSSYTNKGSSKFYAKAELVSKEIKKAVDNNPNILKNTSEGSLLYEAVTQGLRDIVVYFLSKKIADVNGSKKNPPLISAITNGYQEIALLLLKEKKLNIDAKNNYGQTALWITINNKFKGREEIYKKIIGPLLERGASVEIALKYQITKKIIPHEKTMLELLNLKKRVARSAAAGTYRATEKDHKIKKKAENTQPKENSNSSKQVKTRLQAKLKYNPDSKCTKNKITKIITQTPKSNTISNTGFALLVVLLTIVAMVIYNNVSGDKLEEGLPLEVDSNLESEANF